MLARMASSTRTDIWAAATGDFIVLLEWTGKLHYPELSLLTRWVILFKKSLEIQVEVQLKDCLGSCWLPNFLSFFILLLLWKFQCTLELSWQRSNSTEDSPSAWIGEFLGEAALHNLFLPSPACGGCLPPDQPNDKDDPVAVKWRNLVEELGET